MIMHHTEEFLNSRVTWYNQSVDIIMYQEVPKASIQTVDHFFMVLGKMCKSNPKKKYIIIDLSEAELPTAELRRHITNGFKDHADQVKAICVFANKNKLMNIAAQFIISFQPKLFDRMTVHNDLAHCLTKIENVKRTRRT
jgi:hypothetical protein